MSEPKSTSISNPTLIKLIKQHIKCKTASNADIIAETIIDEFSMATTNFILDMCVRENTFTPVEVGSYCMCPAPRFIDYDEDVLSDLGLLPQKSGYVYGIVTGDASWKSTNFKYAAELKVEIFLHTEDKKMIRSEKTIPHLELIPVSKNQIRFFHGKD
jgi:hypothetical protein